MAVPNVNEITTTLRMLSDEQLRKYAQMHKGDPYILPMAISESNARKQLRAAGQATQGAQPQPKVADQAIAQMSPQQLPENVGIGALPAPNMQFAAEGGIMGYEGYGEGDESYGQEPVMMMAGGGAVERYQVGGSIADKYKQESMEMGMGARVQYSPDVQEFARAQTQPSEEEQQAFRDEQQRMLEGGRFRPFPELPKVDERRVTPATAKASTERVTPTFSKDDYSGMDRRIMTGSQLPSIPSISPPAKAASALERSAAPRPGAGGPTAPAAGPRAPAQAGLSDLAKLRQDILSKQQFTDPAATGLKELETRELASAEAEKAALLRDQAKFDDAYKGREKRLLDRELDIGKQKDTNVGLAFLGAAATAMSTPGGLAKALGAAAQVGTAQFSAGLDKIRSAQERLDDARDKMEDLKLNRAEMSAKEIRAAEKSIRSVGVDAQKRTIDGIRMAADVNEKRATDIYKSVVDVGMNREKIAAERENTLIREGGADRRAMMPTGADRTAMMLGEGKTDAQRLESGMRKLQEITADKSGMAAVKLLAETNASRAKEMLAPITMQDLLGSAREYQALMYPKVADVAPTRERPR